MPEEELPDPVSCYQIDDDVAYVNFVRFVVKFSGTSKGTFLQYIEGDVYEFTHPNEKRYRIGKQNIGRTDLIEPML